jgi:hypothetical protein
VDLFGSAMDEADWRIFPVGVAEMRAHTVMKFFFYEKRINRSHRRRQTVRTVFPTVDERSSRPSSSVISCRMHSSLLQKEQQRVKGPDGVSTAGTPMPKLRSKRSIMLRRTINQYAKSFIIIRENLYCTSLRGLFIG